MSSAKQELTILEAQLTTTSKWPGNMYDKLKVDHASVVAFVLNLTLSKYGVS